MATVKAKNLKVAISELLEDYSDRVREAVDQVVTDAGKQARKDIRDASPVRNGEYRESWRVDHESNSFIVNHSSDSFVSGSTSTVYNVNYRLPHLLERDHQLKRGGEKIGEVKGRPHIGPVAEERQATLPPAIKKAIEEAGK